MMEYYIFETDIKFNKQDFSMLAYLVGTLS